MANTNTDLPKYRPLVSLIPGGTLQFLDIRFKTEGMKNLPTEFYEYEKEDTYIAGKTYSLLSFLQKDPLNAGYIDKQTGQTIKDPKTEHPNTNITPTYSFNFNKALEAFIDEWVPLPFIRVNNVAESIANKYYKGPTDWARARVSLLDKPDAQGNTYQLTIVFDTKIEAELELAQINPAKGYPALTEADLKDATEYHLVSDVMHNFWFLQLDWVNEWLHELIKSFKQKKKNNQQSASEPSYLHEHQARYISFLECLTTTHIVPNICLSDPERYFSVDVDLVLDIGNSRSIGMLVERQTGESLSFSNSTVLQLRDLSDPRQTHKNIFNSYMCFAKANLGDTSSHSHKSGRLSPSFNWPSVVRIGTEASRLALFSRRNKGQTSMTCPKRYLWDLKPSIHSWHYCHESHNINWEEPPVITGEYLKYINEEGIPTHVLGDPRYQSLEFLLGQSYLPASEANFSRSSLMMFFFSEIITHALVQINSPANRANRVNTDSARHLRRIILTAPPAMSVSERKILQRWANWSIDVLWKTLDWDSYTDILDEYRQKPEIKINLYEASTTQLVFIYNEIQEKFAGDVEYYFNVFGRVRPQYSNLSSLRIASIDIGGGTSDLMITTYVNESADVTSLIVPNQEFREGFNVAGDDILKAVIENHVITGLKKYLLNIGVKEAKTELIRKLGHFTVGLSEPEKNLRAQFALQVLKPIGIHILNLSEKLSILEAQNKIIDITWHDVFKNKTLPRPEVIEYIAALIPKNNSKTDHQLRNLVFDLDMSSVANTITTTIEPYINDLGEIIKLYDCDYLVLSGRPSCLPAIHSCFFKNPAVLPSRIITMSNYNIESWYPFETLNGKILDPKTTGVVGAVLSTISEVNIQNFHISIKELNPSTTIKFIGLLGKGKDHHIMNKNILFNGIDLENARQKDLYDSIKFASPLYVGFRQLNLERWKATPFYLVNFSSQEAIDRSQKNQLPYEIKFSYQRQFDNINDLDSGGVESILKIEEITSMEGNSIPLSDIELQFKTMTEDFGHWLDTGLFEIY
jgi:hypothetical protein